MTVGIYRITNLINGKIYFGQSTNVEKRLNDHRCNCNHNQHLTNSINKYGVDNFSFELEIATSIPYLNRLEKLFIRKYDTTNREKGYNKDSGGGASYVHSDETKKKISEAKRGKYVGENNPRWKSYARIVNGGKNRHGNKRFKLKFNGKTLKSSTDIHKLIDWWNGNYPTEPLHVEVYDK